MMHGSVVQGVMSFPEMDAMMYKIEGEEMCIRDRRWDALAAYFLPGALIFWHNTDECFTAEEFVRANREYRCV